MIFLALLSFISVASANDLPKLDGHSYCLIYRNYEGLSNYMEQAVVYKFKSINKLPEIHQYSISQISNLTTGKLAEKTYRPKPYSSNKVISLIHKKITKEQQREVDFIYKNLFKKNIEGIYAHPCPYIMREKYNY